MCAMITLHNSIWRKTKRPDEKPSFGNEGVLAENTRKVVVVIIYAQANTGAFLRRFYATFRACDFHAKSSSGVPFLSVAFFGIGAKMRIPH